MAWVAQPFGALFEFIRNGMNVRQDGAGGLPITRIETIANGSVDARKVGFAGLSETTASGWLLSPGDLLLSHINSVEHIGKCALYEGEPKMLVHGMNLLCLRPNRASLVPSFAKYLIRSAGFRTKLLPSVKRAVNQASVSTSDLKKIIVPVPSLAEQRRIADILDRADAMRAKRRAAIRDVLSLQFSAFSQLVAETRCKVERLADVGSVKTGRTPPGGVDGMFGGDIPFMTPGDLESDGPPQRSLSTAGAAHTGTVRAGAALVCCIGKVGQVGRAKVRSAFNQQVNAVEWSARVDDTYGYFALKAAAREIQARATSTTVPILKKSLFELVAIHVPPLGAQREFAAVANAAESLKDSQKKALAELDALFASLQHRAFRGEL